MAGPMKVVFIALPYGEVVAVFPRPAGLHDSPDYWCYPCVEPGVGGSPPAWSGRVAAPREYASVKTRLEAFGFRLEVCDSLAVELFG